MLSNLTTGAGYGKLDVEIRDCHGNSVPMELWKKDNETKVRANMSS